MKYGPRVWLRYFGASRLLKLRIQGVGEAYIRTGDSDFDCVKQVFSWMEYDLSPVLHHLIRRRYEQILDEKIPIIVDAGANIGAATFWFSRCFPDAAIVAVEPDPGTATILRMNVARKSSVRVLEAPIGSERGHAAMISANASFQTVRADHGVAIITVDDAFAASTGDEPLIVKIDVEGFESDLFASNLDWLDKTFVVIIEPHDWMIPGKKTSSSFQRAMSSRGFEIFIRVENLVYAQV